MTIAVVAIVFVVVVLAWLRVIDKEIETERMYRELEEEREREQEQESRAVREAESELDYAMLSLEIRSDAYLDRLDEVVARNNMQIDRLNRIYA